MTIHSYVDFPSGPHRSLLVVNRTAADQIQSMFESTFDRQPVTIQEASLPDLDEDLVVLLGDGEEREVIATSPLSAIRDTILLVNSDLYKTGASDLESFDMPAVLAGLDDVPFRLRGYPESEFEKLLLIVVSRYIEHHAWAAGAGRLRASFQRLSRIDDERGTRDVYEQLAASDVETHVYGVPDHRPTYAKGLNVHAGTSEDYRESWFVLYTPPEDGGESAPTHLGLLAVEVADRTWRGFWTEQSDRVAEIESYVEREL